MCQAANWLQSSSPTTTALSWSGTAAATSSAEPSWSKPCAASSSLASPENRFGGEELPRGQTRTPVRQDFLAGRSPTVRQCTRHLNERDRIQTKRRRNKTDLPLIGLLPSSGR